MTYEEFTVKAQEAILQAQRIAAGFEQQMVDTAHLIKGIIETNEDSAKFILEKGGINIALLDREISRELQGYPRVEGTDKQYLTNEANASLSRAKNAMKEFGDKFITAELMLLGIVAGDGCRPWRRSSG
jgi:ATP-dependent Clp protease ATP-binding subunit ClpB